MNKRIWTSEETILRNAIQKALSKQEAEIIKIIKEKCGVCSFKIKLIKQLEEKT
jgi:hypothetical protein